MLSRLGLPSQASGARAVRRILLSSSAMALVALAACDGDITSPQPPANPRLVPRSVTLAGKRVVLEAYVYRDFAPSFGPDRSGLIAGLRIATSDGSPIPSNIHADAAWIIAGDEVWATPVAEQFPRTPGSAFFEVVARDGPKWPIGTSIAVIVRVRETGGPD